MNRKCWSWIGACSTGSTHIKAATACQDFGSCIEVPYSEGTALIAIVSDGAGSAGFSSIGSRAVVRTMVRQLAEFLRGQSTSPVITEELALQWLDASRDLNFALPGRSEPKPRTFAAPLSPASRVPSV